jgi:PadR family transcriptional regulator
MSAQAPKGHLDLLLLAVVADGPKHGYAVMEELKRRSDDAFDFPEGTVYPALHRLDESGLLSSEWSVVSGRRRRTYRLTDKGKGALGEHGLAWSRFSSAVSGVLQKVPWPITS